jgi:hypothetical protein
MKTKMTSFRWKARLAKMMSLRGRGVEANITGVTPKQKVNKAKQLT